MILEIFSLSFSGLHFPAFAMSTERYGVSLRIQYECRKIRIRKTPNMDTFHAVKTEIKCYLLRNLTNLPAVKVRDNFPKRYFFLWLVIEWNNLWVKVPLKRKCLRFYNKPKTESLIDLIQKGSNYWLDCALSLATYLIINSSMDSKIHFILFLIVMVILNLPIISFSLQRMKS